MWSKLRHCGRNAIRLAIRLLPITVLRQLFDQSLSMMHRKGPDFITIHRRSKLGNTFPYRLVDPIPLQSSELIAIVLQGPSLTEENFTLESIRYYRRVCPELQIIVSTWDDEPKDALDSYRAEGAECVCSAKPTIPGRYNVNFQVVSTSAGIRRAAELGFRYVAKTRTDQRLYAVHVILGLPGLLRAFPIGTSRGQVSRILSTSNLTTKYCPFFLSDMFMFGETNDMAKYWTTTPDDCSTGRLELDRIRSGIDSIVENTAVTPERYLVTDFLSRSNALQDLTVANWWRALAQQFLIIDWAMLDIYWPKYRPNTEHIELPDWERLAHGVTVRFLDWLRLWALPLDESLLPSDDIRLERGASAPLRTAELFHTTI